MSSIVKQFRKAAVDRRRLYLDYSCWLAESEALVDLQVATSPVTTEAPVSVSSSFPDAEHKRLMIYVSGGVAGQKYVMSMVVRTTEGQVKRDDLGLQVT